MANLPIPSRYLVDIDYNLIIQQSQKNQIIQNNTTTLLQMERVAIEEASSYIRQRYDVGEEFTNTSVWNPLSTYLPGDRVYVNYPLWVSGSTYTQYTCVIYNGIGYIANDNITSTSPQLTPATDTHDWTPFGYQYSIYNAVYPYPEFNVDNFYLLGDKVYWNGYIYTCTSATVAFNSESIQQYFIYSNLPELNTFPDSINNNLGQFWGDKTPYIISAYSSSPGTILTDSEYWNIGDNRSQQMVMYLCDIAVYHLHRNIAPDNIPKLRFDAYKSAIEWLMKVARGHVTVDIPQLQGKEAHTIRGYGGNIKQNNRY